MTELRDIKGLEDALLSAEYVVNRRFGLTQTYSAWKAQISESWNLYGGGVRIQKPDGTSEMRLTIENIYHDATRAAARDAAETTSTVSVPAVGNRSSDVNKESLRRAIADGHWAMDPDAQGADHRLIADYLGGAAMFLLSFAPNKQQVEEMGFDPDYVAHTIWNPMNVYPVFFRNRLIEIVNVESVPSAYLAHVYGLPYDPKKAEMWDVIDCITPKEVWKVCTSKKTASDNTGSTWVLDYQPNKIKRIPVSWAGEFALDGSFEIPFLQIGGPLESNNTIAAAIQRQLMKSAYGTLFVSGEVDTTERGPEGTMRGDPDSKVGYIAPPPISGEAFSMMRANEESMRGGASFPPQIQGLRLPSITSGSGISAASGDHEATVRYLQGKLAQVHRGRVEIDFLIDKTYLDRPKPLVFSVGDLKNYTPSDALDGKFRVEVTYPGQGLSQGNRDVLAMEKVGLKIWSPQMAMRQDRDIRNVEETQREIFAADALKLAIDKFNALADLPTSLRFAVMVYKEGKDPIEAAEELLNAPQQLGQIGPQGTPGPVPQPATVGEEVLALQKGALPGGGGGAFPTLGPRPALPPSSQVVVQNPRGP